MRLQCRVHVAGQGNLFMRELADVYGAALRDIGLDAAVVVDQLPVGGDGVVDLVVAPHEYFHFHPLADDDLAELSSRTVVLTTEQPDTPWFSKALPSAAAARAVIDLHDNGVEALAGHRITAQRAPLGYHRSLDVWAGDDRARPIDQLFLGGSTPRRRDVLGAIASRTRGRATRYLLHDPAEPVVEASADFVGGRAKAELLASSKVLLNLHRGDEPYFEWVRAVDAICNGAVLLSEPTVGSAPLEPFVHFVEADPERLADHLIALLHDPVSRDRLARDAYDVLRTDLDLAHQLEALLPLLDDAACTGTPRPAPIELPPSAVAATPRPEPSRESPPVDEAVAADGAAKQVRLAEMAAWRQLEREQAVARHGSADHVDERTTAAWSELQPDVSVVIPHFQLEELLREALESVFASDGVAVEVVLVDDHSPPASLAALHALLDEHEHRAIRLLSRSANGGLGAARNLGLSVARADCCFLLDADNLVGPHALRRLHEALEGSDAAGAYSTIEVFGDESSLMSERPWSKGSLCRGPYIDAMSMIRRSAWDRVGGFEDVDDRLHGWEDHEFWLRVAAAGMHLVHVPEPLSRYRRRAGSMSSLSGLDVVTPQQALRARYPDLPWP